MILYAFCPNGIIYHIWCVFTVVFIVVLTARSLCFRCALTARSLRLGRAPANGPSSALVEAQLGPFLTHLSSTQ